MYTFVYFNNLVPTAYIYIKVKEILKISKKKSGLKIEEGKDGVMHRLQFPLDYVGETLIMCECDRFKRWQVCICFGR